MLRLVDRGLAVLSAIAAALVVLLLFAGPSLIGAKNSSPVAPSGGTTVPTKSSAPTRTTGSTGAATSTGSATSTNSPAAAGAAVFASAGCSSCHTLKAAGATGTIGPDLDQLRPSADAVAGIVRSGGGPMPSFSGKLSDAQITAVAAYVSSVAGH